MSTASQYYIEPLTPEDVAYYEKQRLQGFFECSGGSPRHRCLEPILYEGGYWYQSSARTGRRTLSRRHYCAKHAKTFADQHGLELLRPEEGARRV
jgi:hypothetical protein